MLMRFKDAPDQSMVSAGSADKVMHASMRIGNSTVMASDGRCTGKMAFGGISLSLTVSDDTEAERVFAALANGGQIDHADWPRRFLHRSSGWWPTSSASTGWCWPVRKAEPATRPLPRSSAPGLDIAADQQHSRDTATRCYFSSNPIACSAATILSRPAIAAILPIRPMTRLVQVSAAMSFRAEKAPISAS